MTDDPDPGPPFSSAPVPGTKAATLHQKILSEIEGRIVSGEWPPGTRIPFEVDLAASYDVSRMTVNKVLTQLAGAGLIERRKKLGSVVAQPRTQSAILTISDIEDEVRSLNQPYSFRVVGRQEGRAAEFAPLRFETGKEKVLHLLCLHFAGAQPFCLEERLIDLKTVPQAQRADFDAVAPGRWLTAQIPWTAAEHRILAAAADDRVAGLLQLPPRSACLVIERRTWDAAGPVTVVRFTYPAGKHAVVARFTPASG